MTFRTFPALLMQIYKNFPGIITMLLADAILSKAGKRTLRCKIHTSMLSTSHGPRNELNMQVSFIFSSKVTNLKGVLIYLHIYLLATYTSPTCLASF
jgi:hypothetical protein